MANIIEKYGLKPFSHLKGNLEGMFLNISWILKHIWVFEISVIFKIATMTEQNFKPLTIKLVLAAFLLNTKHWGVRAKTVSLGFRIMSTRRLLFHWANTIKIQLGMLVWYKADVIITFLVHLDQRSMWTIAITWRPSSVVCRLSSVNFSHFKLLLRNHLADWNRT
jgi:hypothetical protein